MHVVCVAVDVEGVVAGGEPEDAGGWGVGGCEAGAVTGGDEGGRVGVQAGVLCWAGAIVGAVWWAGCVVGAGGVFGGGFVGDEGRVEAL